MRKTTLLEYQGETKSLSDWATYLNLTVAGLKHRIRTWGMSDKTFQVHGLAFKGETKSLEAWSKGLGLSKGAVLSRIKRGMPIEHALTSTPFKTRSSLVGHRFNRLVVIEESETRQCGKRLWRCLCDCGGTALVQTGNLIQKNVQSCGCFKIKKDRVVCEKEADAWMWTMLIERQGRRSTNTWPSLWDDEKGAKAEAELQFECKVIKVKGKEPLFLNLRK